MQDALLEQLATDTGKRLIDQGMILATAESCTGGWISKVLTDIPGSSQWFECGFVTYSNASKHALLGVSEDVLDEYGSVSEEVVRQMVQGALQRSKANIAVAVSGIAGPGGGTEDKPVGTVWLACGSDSFLVAEKKLFTGDRESIRRKTVIRALEGIRYHLGKQE